MVARSTDSLDQPGDGTQRPPGTTTPGLKGKPGKRLSAAQSHFPKLAECAHFHYEAVDFGNIQLSLEQGEEAAGDEDPLFVIQVTCQGRTWRVRRSYEELRTLDGHLHCCIFDRRFSRLPPLPPGPRPQVLPPLLRQYLETLSAIVDSNINCGPVLTWMEVDNHGNRLLVNEEASINVPAIAAAHVVKRYAAQTPGELSFEVGDIVSVIDMPPAEDTTWWRGKHGFQVGFFPSECVELFPDRLSPGGKGDGDGPDPGVLAPPGPLSPSLARRRGKLAGLLRAFLRARPSRQRLLQRGILRQRVFGCDLGEHLLNAGTDVPAVLRCCAAFIEQHGLVDGIYRLSGLASNIQRLRHEFDSERVPALARAPFLQDVHSVSSLCKLYFRELPAPLLTHRLHPRFAEAMAVSNEEERLVRVHDVIQQLPPPHYRTLEFLLRHLARVATRSRDTGMHVRNLAIVWAPNLLRSPALEGAGAGGGAEAFREVRIQSLLVEFLLSHVHVLFSRSFTSAGRDGPGHPPLARPNSLLGSSTTPRLLSLEEAQARTQAQAPAPGPGKASPAPDSPEERRGRRAPGGGWKTFFALGRKSQRLGGLLGLGETRPGLGPDAVTLRSAKSEESLMSQTSTAGLAPRTRLRRPRSVSEALSGVGCSPRPPPPSLSCESLASSGGSGGGADSPTAPPAPRTSAWLDDGSDLDLSPPAWLGGARGRGPGPPSLSDDSDWAPHSPPSSDPPHSPLPPQRRPLAPNGPHSPEPLPLRLLRHGLGPPPPPKDPARLMALALAESAHQAARQPRPPARRAQSLEAGGGAWPAAPPPTLQRQQSEGGANGGRRGGPQVLAAWPRPSGPPPAPPKPPRPPEGLYCEIGGAAPVWPPSTYLPTPRPPYGPWEPPLGLCCPPPRPLPPWGHPPEPLYVNLPLPRSSGTQASSGPTSPGDPPELPQKQRGGGPSPLWVPCGVGGPLLHLYPPPSPLGPGPPYPPPPQPSDRALPPPGCLGSPWAAQTRSYC